MISMGFVEMLTSIMFTKNCLLYFHTSNNNFVVLLLNTLKSTYLTFFTFDTLMHQLNPIVFQNSPSNLKI